MSEQIVIIIVGALAGLFPVLLTSVLSWLEKRSLEAKQNRALDLAKRHIEFLDSWVQVQETLCSAQISVETIQSDLFVLILFFVLPLLFIRWLAVRTDRKAEEKKEMYETD